VDPADASACVFCCCCCCCQCCVLMCWRMSLQLWQPAVTAASTADHCRTPCSTHMHKGTRGERVYTLCVWGGGEGWGWREGDVGRSGGGGGGCETKPGR